MCAVDPDRVCGPIVSAGYERVRERSSIANIEHRGGAVLRRIGDAEPKVIERRYRVPHSGISGIPRITAQAWIFNGSVTSHDAIFFAHRRAASFPIRLVALW
jgi:hypothetical protein